MTKPPTYFAIPRGTPLATCRSCGAVIYWIVTSAGRRAPMSLAEAGCTVPTRTTDGTGISHFIDCPHATQHRRPR